MLNNFMKKEIKEIDIIDIDILKEGTTINYYERSSFSDINEDWSWSYVGIGEILKVWEDEVHLMAGNYYFNLSIEELQDGFHKIEIINSQSIK